MPNLPVDASLPRGTTSKKRPSRTKPGPKSSTNQEEEEEEEEASTRSSPRSLPSQAGPEALLNNSSAEAKELPKASTLTQAKQDPTACLAWVKAFGFRKLFASAEELFSRASGPAWLGRLFGELLCFGRKLSRLLGPSCEWWLLLPLFSWSFLFSVWFPAWCDSASSWRWFLGEATHQRKGSAPHLTSTC